VSRRYTDVAEDALTLPQDEQLRLARTLLEKVEAGAEMGSEAAWEEEIERRIQKIDAGLATGRPFSDVLREVDARFGK
jgi:putative addiction module component (TIGR02574 family)